MPITFTPSTPGNLVGFGMTLQWVSSFVGPLPTGSFWDLSVFVDADATQLMTEEHFPTTTVFGQSLLGASFNNVVVLDSEFNLRDGDTATVRVQLHSPTAILDQTTTTFTWSNTAGMRQMVNQLLASHSGTGLTSTQSSQLTAINNATQVPITTSTGIQTVGLSQILAMPLLDTITLSEITSGPTSGFVGVTPAHSAPGIIVRVTNIGPGYAATSPGDSWYVPELAAVLFFRGSDIVARIGIHTVSRMIYPLPGAWEWWASLLFGGTLPPDYSIQVNFNNGILGRVFVMNLP